MPNTEDYIGVVISDVARLLRTAFDRRLSLLAKYAGRPFRSPMATTGSRIE